MANDLSMKSAGNEPVIDPATDSTTEPATDPTIGTLNESSLHQGLKDWYCQQLRRVDSRLELRTEVPLDGYVIDLVAGSQLIEMQTTALGRMRQKLRHLLLENRVRVVYPVAVTSLLEGERDGRRTRRRSPKRGRLTDVLDELVSVPDFLLHPNFELEALLIDVAIDRCWNPALRRRRGGWQTLDRRLVGVTDSVRFNGADALWSLCRERPAGDFDTSELAALLDAPRPVGQKLAYCLKAVKAIEPVGKNGNSIVYRACELAKCPGTSD